MFRIFAYLLLFASCFSFFGCAATGLRDVPDQITCNVKLSVQGALVLDKSKSIPLSAVIVSVISPDGETKKYFSDNNGDVNFSLVVPTVVKRSSVMYRLPVSIEVSKDGYFTKMSNLTEVRNWRWGEPDVANFFETIMLFSNLQKKIIVSDESNNPISQAKVIAISKDKIINRWYTKNDGVSDIDLMEAYNYSNDCKTLIEKDGYMCVTNELGYRCFEDDILNLTNVYVKMANQDNYIRSRCCDDLDFYVTPAVSLELGYWLIDMAQKYNMRLDSICIKEHKGKKYLSVNLFSSSSQRGNRLSDYDVAKKYFMLLVIDFIKSPIYTKPNNDYLYGFNINLDADITYYSQDNELLETNSSQLEYYFSSDDAKNFLEQKISRQQFADKTITIARGDLIDLILR